MRIYRLASSEYRDSVDLKNYEELIKNIIHSIVPTLTVIVESKCYMIVESIEKGDAIKIGRSIAKSVLGQFCIQRPILFIGTEITESFIEGELEDE